jgi:hypothetical protein
MNEHHWSDEVFYLHDKQKLSPLSPYERQTYATARAEVMRGLVAAQELMRQRGQPERTSLRIGHTLPVMLEIGGQRVASVTTNVSTGGCAVLLDAPPAAREIGIVLRFPCGAGIRGRAQVVAVVNRAGVFTVCLRFLGMNELDRALLEDAIVDVVFEHLASDRQRHVLRLLGGGYLASLA